MSGFVLPRRVAMGRPGLLVVIIVVFAAVLYLPLIHWRTNDAVYWFIPWLEHIINDGVVQSLAEPMALKLEGTNGSANYNPPYLYLLAIGSLARDALDALIIVKMVSIVGVLFCVVAVYRLLRIYISPPEALVGATGTMLLPTVALNAAAWGQTDAIYAGLVVLAVAAAIQKHWIWMMIALGSALAFKAQAVLIGPFVLYMMITFRIPPWTVILTPLTYVIFLLPAIAAGRPVAGLLDVYFEQAQAYRRLSMGAPNLWTYLQHLDVMTYENGVAAGIGLTALVGIAIGILGWRWRFASRESLLLVATLSSVSMPYLLPKMHDRYFFLADILSYALAVVQPRVWTLAVAVATQLGSLSAYGLFLLGFRAGPYLGSIFTSTALLLLVVQLLRLISSCTKAEFAGQTSDQLEAPDTHQSEDTEYGSKVCR